MLNTFIYLCIESINIKQGGRQKFSFNIRCFIAAEVVKYNL